MKITPTKDLFHAMFSETVPCFTKGKIYETQGEVDLNSRHKGSLINDFDHLHAIGDWWPDFKIVEHKHYLYNNSSKCFFSNGGGKTEDFKYAFSTSDYDAALQIQILLNHIGDCEDWIIIDKIS